MSGLTLYLSQLDPGNPLPAAYVSVPDVQVGPGMGGLDCPRCHNAWVGHDWVVYLTANRQVIDCSIEARRLDTQW